jgi:hypothetical protein
MPRFISSPLHAADDALPRHYFRFRRHIFTPIFVIFILPSAITHARCQRQALRAR